jgi:predicted extracellular nuclease
MRLMMILMARLLCVLFLTQAVGCVPETERPEFQATSPDDRLDIQPRAGITIRVATWNVRRFFDTNCDSGSCGGDEFEALPTQQEFDARADEIAEAIRSLNAEVVLLQEVESQACLDALSARLGDVFDVFLIGETRLSASLDTVVLSKGSVQEVRTHRQDSFQLPEGGQTRFERELLEVHLLIDARRVAVFTAHFKSKSNDNPSKRLAEATRAREVVLGTADELGDALIVLGGDLNDTPGSEPLDAIEEDGRLVRVAQDLDPDSWTHIFRGNIEALDHLYHVKGKGTYLSGSAEVRRDNGRFGGSDHAALLADFSL